MAQPVIERAPLPIPPRDERGIFGWAATLMRVLADTFQSHGLAINERIDVFGGTAMQAPLPLAHFPSGERPAPEAHPGAVIFVPDAPAGQKFQGSDGASWVGLG